MNLALDFGVPPDVALPATAPQALAARFEESMQQDGSPVRAVRHQPAKPANFVAFPEQLVPALRSAMSARGIQQLYSHQAAAIELAFAGKNVAVVTPTASGKTLCYNLPVVQEILANPQLALCICSRPKRWRRINAWNFSA